MAIEVTPKRKIKLPLLIAIIFGAILLLIGFTLLGSYFYFGIQIKKMSKELEEKNQIVLPLVENIKKKEEEIAPLFQKIDDFGDLVLKHKETVKVLKFIEKVTLPRVWFQNFSFNSQTGAITLSGETESLLMFEYQTFVLNREPLIKNLNLTGVTMTEEGKVSFNYQFNVNPN